MGTCVGGAPTGHGSLTGPKAEGKVLTNLICQCFRLCYFIDFDFFIELQRMQASRHDHCSAVSNHVDQLYIYQIVYFLFLTSLLLPFICIFGLPGILICCTGVAPLQSEALNRRFALRFRFLFSLFLFCGKWYADVNPIICAYM